MNPIEQEVFPVSEAPFDGGVRMGEWELIGGGQRRSFVSLEDKVKAIAEIYVRGRPVKDVLEPIYQKAEKEMPENISVIISNWRKSIQTKLDEKDEFTVNLCKAHGVIRQKSAAEEEEEAPAPVKRGASRKK